MRLYHNFQLSPAKVHSILYGLEVFFSPKVGGVETVTQQGGEANGRWLTSPFRRSAGEDSLMSKSRGKTRRKENGFVEQWKWRKCGAFRMAEVQMTCFLKASE